MATIPAITPRIGITCSPLRGRDYYRRYFRAIEIAGGEPVAIEPPPDGATRPAADLLRDVDGLLLPGGWDIDPAAYGETRASDTAEVDPALDRTEAALIQAASGAALPVLGICRGQQMVNVALGGSLWQHIDGHDGHARPRDELAHAVDLDPDSEFGRAAPVATLAVNSLHHQSVKDVAPGLRVTARSPDGTVEGVESADALVVAVQCHPEELVDQHDWARTLFARFVDRARERARAVLPERRLEPPPVRTIQR